MQAPGPSGAAPFPGRHSFLFSQENGSLAKEKRRRDRAEEIEKNGLLWRGERPVLLLKFLGGIQSIHYGQTGNPGCL